MFGFAPKPNKGFDIEHLALKGLLVNLCISAVYFMAHPLDLSMENKFPWIEPFQRNVFNKVASNEF